MSGTGIRTYTDAIAIVTGGGSGIGEALGKALARRGALAILADRRPSEAERVAATIRREGGRAEAHPLDVRDASAFDALVADVMARHGRLDYLFNNAGIGVAGETKDLAIDDWRAIVEVNVMGVVHGVHAAYPRMASQGFGHLVNTASMAGLMPSPMTVPYGMTKYAVVGLSRSLRAEGAHYGVRVTALCPGVIRTPILGGGAYGRIANAPPPDVQAAVWERTRPMDPDRFADRVLDQLARNPDTIVVPGAWRLLDFANRLSPTLGGFLAARIFENAKSVFDKGRLP